ncbi:MAG: PAS domain-containing protein, partial [Thioalkalispiraceae bacterium]
MAQTGNILEVLRHKLISDAEARWCTLTENSPNQIMFLDPEGTILFSNRPLPLLDSQADLIGQSIYDHLSEKDAQLFNQAFEMVFNTGKAELLEIRDARLEQERIFETHIYPVKESDAVIALVTETRDVSEQRLKQESLERSHTLLHTVITNSPIIIWALDDKGIFTLSAGKGLAELGYAEGEVVGESIFDIYKDHPEILTNAEQALQGEAVKSIINLNGRTYQTNYRPVFDAEGQVTSVIGVANDITRSETAESQVHIISAALETTSDLVMITDVNG